MLTQAILKENLHYDPVTGVFSWIKKTSKFQPVEIGQVAGCNKGNYCTISLYSVVYRAHRLAWLYMTGKWPSNLVDHKDNNGHNNSWVNLREADYPQNNSNTIVRKDNTSGVKGINMQDGRWRVRVQHRGVRYDLGMFDEISFAKEVLEDKRAELHGDFANDG